ncbi:MAG: hypothetical protein J0H94_04455 [Rhizobiales bacterium]|nr:hypothetical protein [Hyphomicrobiales bacterium]
MFDRKAFFDAVRVKPFGKALTQSQVDGMNIILDAWDKSGFYDTRWLAYMLATAFHETDRTMQPIREYGRGKGMKYGTTYYGRGFVQLTWKANYQKAKDKLGEDFVGNPDLALRPDLAAKIMFLGMSEGWFTSKELSDYISGSTCDYKNARRIINGTDKATTIAGYAVSFQNAIQDAVAPLPAPPPDIPAPEPSPPVPPDVEPASPAPSGGVSIWPFAIAAAVVVAVIAFILH